MNHAPGAPRIAVVGNYVVDMIVRPVVKLPNPGELMLVDDISIAGGGAGFGSSVVLARLGASVYSVGAVGRDGQGAQMLGWLAAEGVDTTYVSEVDGPTSSTVVVVSPDGERSYLHAPGASNAMRIDLRMLDTPGLRAVHVGAALIVGGLDVEEACVNLLRAARERGIATSLDTSWDGSGRWGRVLPYLPHLDVFCPSLVEARNITGQERVEDVANWIRARGTCAVVVHAGAEGAFVSSPEFTGWLAANRVQVVDTTGAGEAFDAGLVYGLVSGWAIEDATRLACAVGALATTQPGCVDGITGLAPALELAGMS